MRTWLVGVVVLLLSGSASAAAQVPAPSRGPLPPPPAGTARISGRVVDAVTNMPVARARVRIDGLRGVSIPVATDDTGAFQLVRVPACMCALTVDKAGYLQSRYPEGGPSFRRSRRLLTVGENEVISDVLVPLYRGGSVNGRIVDAFGDPVESARVQLLRLQAGGAPQPRGGASTDDRGEFRVARLEPGRYLLFVEHRNQADDPNLLQPVPTFYPGVADMAQAQPITIDRGREVTGLELSLLAGATAWVSGTVIGEDGAPMTGRSGVFVSARRTGGGTIDYGQFMVETPGDGTFRARLPPGDYEIEARTGSPPAGPGVGGDERLGTLEVSVNGAPVSNLSVQLRPGATLTGRFVFEGAGAPPPEASASETVTASFSALPGGRCRRGNVQNGSGRVPVETAPDWRFRIDGLFGTCVTSFLPVNLGPWSVVGFYHGDVDLLDRPITYQPGQQVSGLRVVLSDRRTQLTLRVSDERGLATREYVALVFPLDPIRWTVTSRFMRAFLPPPPPAAGNGSAVITAAIATVDTVTGLPPGDYYAIAVDDIGFDAVSDPEVLARLAETASRVRLTERDAIGVDLRRESLDEILKR